MTQQNEQQESGLTLQELVGLLWNGKVTLIISVALAASLALFYLWIATPVYSVDAMIQVEDKKGGASAMFGEMGDMFDMASPAETEIEIIKSRMVVGKVVEQLKLDIVATPKVLPVVGKALLRRNPNPPKLMVESFDIPQELEDKPFTLIAQGNGKYSLSLRETSVLQGQVGEMAVGLLGSDSIRLFVSSLQGKSGQVFKLLHLPLLKAIDDLNSKLSAMEKGKKTGILALSLQGADVALTTKILNAIAQGYVQQNVDRKSAEAEKTLEFLRGQLPDLKAKADTAENHLNSFRLQVGSIDLNAESKLILDQGVDLESKMLVLQQQKAELLRLYKEDHPNVKTLDAQIERLKQGMGGVSSQIRKLPKTQQEILRLSQEAKVAAELYNNMLNNAQQLEVAKAGQVGNVRVIDNAMASYTPVKPKKASTFVLICLLGAFAGAGIVLLRRFWSKGIDDPKVLEQHFGLPVYANIPHSNSQRKVLDAFRKHVPGMHLLSTQEPDDLAVEAFRSLRTTLHFSMHDAPNNILLLAGASPGIGKSFVAANLATILAQTGKRVCLIDGDMRRGHLHDAFGMEREPGLSDYLSSKATLDVVLRSTPVDSLSLISTGTVPPNPSEMLLSSRMAGLSQQLSADFDLVIIDSPPLLAVADALVLAKIAGSTLLVLKHGAHRIEEIEQMLKRLEHGDVKAKGAIFNDVVMGTAGYSYGYAYQYKYGKKKGTK